MEKLMKEYGTFEPVVAALKEQRPLANYLGEGAQWNVWYAEVGGEPFAVKLANKLSIRGRQRDTVSAVESVATLAQRAVGIVGLEQIRAASPQDGAAIFEYVDGTLAADMSNANSVSDEAVAELVETVKRATSAGIEMDGWNSDGGNAFYSEKAGFTLIDYLPLPNERVTWAMNLKYTLRSLGRIGNDLVLRGNMSYVLAGKAEKWEN